MFQFAPLPFTGHSSTRETKPLLTENAHHTERRTHTSKRLEQQAEGLLNLLVWIENDAACVIIGQAKRQLHCQFSSLRLVE
jgi:hypothetical protein